MGLQVFGGDEFLAFDCVGGGAVEGAVDVQVVVFELPAVDYYIGCQKRGFDVLGESIIKTRKQVR